MGILRIGTDFSDEATYSFVMDNFSGRMTAETKMERVQAFSNTHDGELWRES